MRTWAITKRVLKELFRDKRTLMLIFIAPLIVLALMNYIFGVNTTTDVTIGTVHVSQTVNQNLTKVQHVQVQKYHSQADVQQALKYEKIDSSLIKHGDHYQLTHANVDTGKTKLAKSAVQVALTQNNIRHLTTSLTKMQMLMPQGRAPKLSTKIPQIHNRYNYGDGNSTFFAKLMPILMGFFVFFFVFLISGMALLNERTSGTLDRLLATPVKRSDIIFGYMLSYGLIAILQTLLIVCFTIYGLKVQVIGSIGIVILVTVLLALIALSLGIFLSTFAKSEFQMVQFIPVVVVPQIFFSGIIPLTSMAAWAQWLANILPMKYAADALTNVIMKGSTLIDVSGDLLIMVLFIIILTISNIVGLKRYRKV
ncbi:ABC transporter permease [Bombilactobacillus folatiphilus]|uniref:ABC transporter permease n=1 Tax=Bombilactobacillus folatiphilus TaxID=2923362 RepID=A0ABY4PAI9_9LACO|nr:ABC transporter permease [Bombilactobacillus folatiphilus]UQS82536.1 ABC transporter permease [Bombilactobacillus folatiphilus]